VYQNKNTQQIESEFRKEKTNVRENEKSHQKNELSETGA
tara:strand:- start:819 stop:935 length:117 start_codon:yes stop_codon:yes gene_type:complete